jgi:hypothetical protein
MTSICACNYPIWIYDSGGKEYFALPVEIAEDIGIRTQKEFGDLEVTINRDDQDIKFLAIPFETVSERDVEIPDIEIVDHESGGVIKQFMKVTIIKVGKGTYTKKYDVKGHIFIAGCEFSDTIKNMESDNMKSDSKESESPKCIDKLIYEILHPIDEFIEKHIVEI